MSRAGGGAGGRGKQASIHGVWCPMAFSKLKGALRKVPSAP
jgi:hypothetical protein